MADVTLRPMTAAEYAAFVAVELDEYATDIARSSGMPLDAARERARKQHEELLPHGLATPGHSFSIVLDSAGREVGRLWLGPHPQRPGVGYVYDVGIDEAERGKGLGRAAMLAAEQVARAQGQTEIGLNVFGFNDPARSLYDSLGYRVVATQMLKRLD